MLEKQDNNGSFLTGPGALSMGFCRYYRQQLGRARLPAGVRVISVFQLYDFISPHIPCRPKSDGAPLEFETGAEPIVISEGGLTGGVRRVGFWCC